MAKGVWVKVKRNDFSRIAGQLPIAAASIVGQRGQEMETIAKQRSRVDTGEMRDGWRFETRGRGGSGSLINEVEHTVFNEYGTRNMSAQPMARPAAEQVFPKIREDFEQLERYLS